MPHNCVFAHNNNNQTTTTTKQQHHEPEFRPGGPRHAGPHGEPAAVRTVPAKQRGRPEREI